MGFFSSILGGAIGGPLGLLSGGFGGDLTESSSSSSVRPVGELFDAGIFSKAPQNEEARKRALALEQILGQSQFLQDPSILNDLIQRLARGGSFLSGPQGKFITDQAQGRANPRGLGQITEAERISALAPFELQARDQATRTLSGLSTARGFDIGSLFELLTEARPDLLVGSETKNVFRPSPLASLTSIFSAGASAIGTAKGLKA